MIDDLNLQLPPLIRSDAEGLQHYLNDVALDIGRITRSDASLIWLHDGQGRLTLRGASGAALRLQNLNVHYDVGAGGHSGLTAFVFAKAEAIRCNSLEDIRRHPYHRGAYDAVLFRDSPEVRCGALIAMPIVAVGPNAGLPLGVIKLERFIDAAPASAAPYLADEFRLLESVATQLGSVLSKLPLIPFQPLESTLVYREPSVQIEVISAINTELIAYLAKHPNDLYRLHHRSFEELIAELLLRQGWAVELTLPSRDGGYDVIAIRTAGDVHIQLLVQAKKYRPDRPVGVSTIRELFTVKQRKHATMAMVATTSYVSAAAKNEFRDVIPWELELREYGDLVSWLEGCAR